MSNTHPLLEKIDIQNIDNIDDAFLKIKKLGLQTKIYDNKIIIKYPKSMKYSRDDYIRKSRGIILDFDKKKIINTSIEGCLDNSSFFEIVKDWDDIVIEECLDGVLLNLYYDNDTWKISTKFCVNADESKFRSEKSFRKLFDEINTLDFNTFDKHYTYSLLLQHKNARNISLINQNSIYHLESTNNISNDKIQIKIGEYKYPKILKYQKLINLINVNTFEQLKKNVENLHWCHPGYIIYSKDRNFKTKLENPNFKKVNDLVKDHGDINYLLLDSHYSKKNSDTLLKYFPEYKDKLLKINNAFYDYTLNLHEFYMECKVYRNYVDLERKYKKALCDLHNLFISKRKIGDNHFKITYNEVCKLVSNYDTPYLYSILLS